MATPSGTSDPNKIDNRTDVATQQAVAIGTSPATEGSQSSHPRQEAAEWVRPGHEAVEAAKQIYHDIKCLCPLAVDNFEQRWTAWRNKFPSTEVSSDMFQSCTDVEEFDALKRLGPKIIPFVFYKLASNLDENARGVFLYDALETKSEYMVEDAKPLTSQDILKAHGAQIVELNYKRDKIARKLVDGWAEYHQSMSMNLTRVDCTCQEEYRDLLKMGPSIIAYIMIGYSQFPEGYWYELLHEMLHGHQTYSHITRKRNSFDAFRWFFEVGEHVQAPLYIPTAADLKIYQSQMSPELVEYFRREWASVPE